ncbi:hypothetical protein ACFE04_031924 [Oxalis oulophora]
MARQTDKRNRKIHDEDHLVITESTTNGPEEKVEPAKCHEPCQEEKIELPIQDEENITTSLEMRKKQKKALLELRCIIEDAILGNYLLEKPNKNLLPKEKARAIHKLKQITLWGVPLLPSKDHEGTNIILLKFLKVNGYKVHSAFKMIRKTLIWRRENKVDEIIDKKIDPDLDRIVRLSGTDRKSHPVSYNAYGILPEKDLYKMFGTEDGFKKFLRWKIQNMEKGIRKLDFKPDGADSIIQITDWKNSSGSGINVLRPAKKLVSLLHNHYPGIIHKNIVINAPFWSYASHVLSSRLLSQRTMSRVIFVRPSKVTATLLKYIAPENLAVEYGGLKRENDTEFSPEDEAKEFIVKGGTTDYIQIPVSEPGVTMVWDLTVVKWDVSYKEEFIPDDEGSYNVLIQKEKERKKKVGESVRTSFYIHEAGKIVITINNPAMKKRKVYYRYKAKPTLPLYVSSRLRSLDSS